MSLQEINQFKLYQPEKYFVLPGEQKEFNYSDGIEEEKYILDSIFNSEDRCSSSDELNRKIRDWSSKYHLSKERANIIRAIDFEDKKKLKILEIGGGCGAITRYLGEEFGQVDTI